MPEGTRGTLAIYQATLDLTRECELHPDLVSQTFGYLFFFSNASLFNTLMEKGKVMSLMKLNYLYCMAVKTLNKNISFYF